MHSTDTDMETSANETKIIRTRRNASKTQYSPDGREIVIVGALPFNGEGSVLTVLTCTYRGTCQLKCGAPQSEDLPLEGSRVEVNRLRQMLRERELWRCGRQRGCRHWRGRLEVKAANVSGVCTRSRSWERSPSGLPQQHDMVDAYDIDVVDHGGVGGRLSVAFSPSSIRPPLVAGRQLWRRRRR